MTLFQPPSFYRNYACVADDAALAAAFSSLVGGEGEYVSVLESPRIRRPDGGNEVTRRCNSVARVRPRALLLAGVGAKAGAELDRHLGTQVPVIRADSVDEVLAVVGAAQRRPLVSEIRCQLVDVGPALLQAKRQCKSLRVDPSAPRLGQPEPSDRPHVVVLDDHGPLAQVIAANYAFSIGADLLLIPERDDNLREQMYAEIDARGAYQGEERGRRAQVALGNLRRVLEPSLQFGPRQFVTFITRGIPYGYFYRGAPSTHLFSYPNLGEVINAGIYWATVEPFVSAAVVVDPGHFTTSETPVVSASLKGDGVCVFEVLGAAATVENTKLFVQTFPYDLLFICSHCGEVGGERMTVRVPDASSSMHTIEIDEVVQIGSMRFGSKPGQQVQVHQLLRPVAIDGVDWHSAGPELRQHLQAIWYHFLSVSRDKWDILRQEKVKRVPHSTAVKLKRGALMLNLQQVIDARVSPIIFNNTCVSFYDAARTLTFAGARAYIGTLTPVNSASAQGLAETLFAERQRTMSLPLALADAQARIFNDRDDRTYVHVGCHFEAIRPPTKSASLVVRQRIDATLADWQSQVTQIDEQMKESAMAVIRFLSHFH